MTVTPVYPVILIVGKNGLPVIADDPQGNECLIAYQTLELAELYLEQAGQGNTTREVDESTLLSIIRDNPTVRSVAWNNTAKAQTFIVIPVEQLLR